MITTSKSGMQNPHLRVARQIATLMDNQFKVLGIGVGLDSIIGLIPGIGDMLTLFFSLYLIWIGYQIKLPTPKLLQMVANVGIDTVIGSIPFIGDIGDVFFKANMKNLKILEDFERGEVIEGEIIR